MTQSNAFDALVRPAAHRLRSSGPARAASFVLAAMVVALAPQAQARPRMDPGLDAAVTEFVAAQGGDEGLIKKSAQTLDALAAQPERSRSPLVLAFAGAAHARLAETTIFPWSKMRYAEDGLALVDKALQRLDPKDDTPDPGHTPVAKEVRFVAASLFFVLPSIFNRRAQADKLLDGLLATVETDATPPDFKAAVAVLAGQRAAKAGDKAQARRYFDKATGYGSPQEAEDARRELKALGA